MSLRSESSYRRTCQCLFLVCAYMFRPGEGQLMLPYRVLEEATQSELPKPASSMLVKGMGKSSDCGIWAFWRSWHPGRWGADTSIVYSLGKVRGLCLGTWKCSLLTWEGYDPPNSRILLSILCWKCSGFLYKEVYSCISKVTGSNADFSFSLLSPAPHLSMSCW